MKRNSYKALIFGGMLCLGILASSIVPAQAQRVRVSPLNRNNQGLGEKQDSRKVSLKNKARASFNLKSPFAKLDNVDGWTNISLKRNDWYGLKNEIEDFDTFDTYEFGVAELLPQKKNFLYLKKTFTRTDLPTVVDKDFFKKNDVVYYVIDPGTYYSKVAPVVDTKDDNFLVFNVIEQTRGENLVANNILDYIKNPNAPVDRPSSIAIKYRNFPDEGVVRFMIYPMLGDYIDLKRAFDNKSYREKTFVTEEIGSMLMSSDMYDNVYYEVKSKTFMKFIKAPLKHTK